MQRHPTVGSERLGRGKRELAGRWRVGSRGAGGGREKKLKRDGEGRRWRRCARASYTRVNALAVRRAF